MKQTKYFSWFLTLFVTLLVVSNIISGRLFQVGNIVLTSAAIFFPLTYVLGDIIPEVYGYAKARKMIWFGALANLVMVSIFMIVNILPAPVWFDGVSAYTLVLGTVPRIVAASLVAYWVGSFVNAFILSKMKEWMVKWDPNHKHLYLRTIGSTIGGEGIDSLLFIFGAFLFVLPFEAVVSMFFIQWAWKTFIEIVMTPVTMIVCKKIKELEGIDEVGADSYSPFATE